MRVPIDSLSGAKGLSLEGRGARLLATRAAITQRTRVCAPIRFTAVGLTYRQRGPGHLDAHVAVEQEGGSFGRATVVEGDNGDGPDESSPEARSDVDATALLWTGPTRCIRLSLHLPAGATVSDLSAVFINSSGTADGEEADTEEVTASGGWFGADSAEAMTTRPDIVTREEWGADESMRNCGPEYADGLEMAFVHHTAGSNDYTRAESDDIVRSIFHYHAQVRGWCDIAYNFLVDRFGTIFEGRAGGVRRPVIPAATMGFNTGSVAVSVMGNFMDAYPSKATTQSVKSLLVWRLDLAHLPPDGWAQMTSAGGSSTRYAEGTTVTLKVISPHRKTGYTECPGDHLKERIPRIRRAVTAMGNPKIFRPSRTRRRIEPGERVGLHAYSNRELAWRVQIYGPDRVPVRSYARSGAELAIGWKGRDDAGVPVPPGRYRVIMRATGEGGRVARHAAVRVVVEEPS